EYSPEKAGVGGSIPSVATMFSSTSEQLAGDWRELAKRVEREIAQAQKASSCSSNPDSGAPAQTTAAGISNSGVPPCFARDGSRINLGAHFLESILLRGGCGFCRTLPESAELRALSSLPATGLAGLIIPRSLVRVQPPPPPLTVLFS